MPRKRKEKLGNKSEKNREEKTKGKSRGSSVTFCACMFFQISNLVSGTRNSILLDLYGLLWSDKDQKMARLASNGVLLHIFEGQMGKGTNIG